MSKKERVLSIPKTELLAPAGSIVALEAALKAGADAVYIGGTKFGARAYADNPEEQDLVDAIDRVHLLDKKLYMTVNTLLKDQEIQKELYSYMKAFFEHGLDGVIVQDLGVASFLHREFPELELHASTQMAITGAESALFLKELGFSRVVPAREMSLEEIKNIYRQTGLEIESFVHGAMCYSVSGMCLMSSLIGGRSGNRGRCAGVCRLPFTVRDGGKTINDRNAAYPLNMKDMCALPVLPQMIDAGVVSFKIEGRMKRPEYTAGITRIYRKYIDRYAADPANYHVEKNDLEELSTLFNRDGFTEGYYRQHNGRDMIALRNEKMTEQKGDGRTKEAGLLYDQIARQLQKTNLQRPIEGDLYLSAEESAVLNLSDQGKDDLFASAYGDVVEPAQKQPMTEERIKSQLQKTGNSDFCFSRLDIHMPEENIFVPVKSLNELRREGFANLREEILGKYRRECKVDDERQRVDSQPVGSEIAYDKNISLQKGRYVERMDRRSGDACGKQKTVLYILAEEEKLLGQLIGENIPYVDGFYVPLLFPSNMKEMRRKNTQAEGKLIPTRHTKFGQVCSNQVGTGKEENFTSGTELIGRILDSGKKVRLVMPYLLRMDYVDACEKRLRQILMDFPGKIDAILVRNMDSVGLLRRMGLEKLIMLDSSVYVMNGYSRDFWRKQGIERDTLSHELNFRELKSMDNHSSEMVIYGRTPMMISAQCLQKTLRGCDHSFAHLTLTDRKSAHFPVVCDCRFCYNIIYNSLPLSLLDEKKSIMEIGASSLRLTFTNENLKMAKAVLTSYENNFMSSGNAGEKDSSRIDHFTKEHFRRGVE